MKQATHMDASVFVEGASEGGARTPRVAQSSSDVTLNPRERPTMPAIPAARRAHCTSR